MMNFNNGEPLSATTVVVDVDTMAEELKRLKERKSGEQPELDSRAHRNDETPPESPPTSQGGKADEPPPESPPTSQGGKADETPSLSPSTLQEGKADETPLKSLSTSQGGKAVGPVHRPSWGGRFPPVAKPEGVSEDRELGAFRCGR